jgi:RNA polymerase sigma factor (sigma-70 family)
VTDTLTFDQITAAQANDLGATAAVIAATETRVTKLAERAARRMAAGGPRYEDALDEFTQVGRIAVWEALPRFKGETVDSFFAFIYTTVDGTLMDAVRSERNGAAGADADAMKVFGAMLELTNGDVFAAEKLAQTAPPTGKRLSADRANAARLAWQGTQSLDVPPQTTRATSPGGAVRFVQALSELVPDDLTTADDLNSEDRRAKHTLVHSVLDSLGEGQRKVIEHSFGIRGAANFGHGDGCDNAGMAAFLGIPVCNLRPARTKGMKNFAKRWVATVRAWDAPLADTLEIAAALCLAHGGRK